MLRIVTDGAADMPESWGEEFEIDTLPLRIRFGEETFVQGVDVDQSNFYQLVEEKRMIPGTSLPSPEQVMEFYRSVARKGEEILSIHVSSKMSGTFSVVELAAKELAGELRVYPFDSAAGSAVMGLMCREARILARTGASVQKILDRLAQMRSRLALAFTMDRLDFACMNGRVNALQSVLSSALGIKPIIILKDGLLQMGDKVRTRQRALQHVIQTVKEQVGRLPVTVAVVHAADPQAAQDLIAQVRAQLNVRELIQTELSIPVAANLGPGTVGIVALPMQERG